MCWKSSQKCTGAIDEARHNSGCRLCCRLCTEIFNSPRGLACFKWSCEKLQFLALKIFSLQRLLSTTYMQSQKAFHVPPIYHSFHFFLFSYSEWWISDTQYLICIMIGTIRNTNQWWKGNNSSLILFYESAMQFTARDLQSKCLDNTFF